MANSMKTMMSSPNYLGAWMAGQKYNANAGLPNEHDATADFFGQVKQQFTKNGKPRGADALIAGLGAGLEHAYKLKGIGMRKEELKKYNDVMDYFMAVNTEAEKQQRELANREAQRKMLMPYATAGLELAYSGQPYDSVNERIRNLFEQVQMNDPAIKGKYMGFVPNSPMVLVRDDNGKNSVVSLSAIVGEDATKRVQQGWVDQQKAAVDQHRAEAAAYKDYAAGNKYNVEAEYMPQTVDLREREARTAEKNAMTRFEALGLRNVNELVPRLQAATVTAKLADDVLKDASKHPDIFNSVLSGWINTKGDAGAFSLWMQKMIPAKDRDAYMRVAKNLNNLMLSEVKGIGGQNNMTIDAWIKEGTPNMQYSAQNIEYMIGQAKAKAEFYRDLYRDTLHNTGGANIGAAYDRRLQELESRSTQLRNTLDQGMSSPQMPSPAAPSPQQSQAVQMPQPMAEGGQYTKMMKPDGSLVMVHPDDVSEAVQSGYKVAE